MSSPNRELFREILRQIESEPGSHNQADWEWDTTLELDFSPWIEANDGSGSIPACRTTRCVAGWAIWIGLEADGSQSVNELALDYVRENGLSEAFHSAPFVAGQHLLKLNDDEADDLFLGSDNEKALRLVRKYASDE